MANPFTSLAVNKNHHCLRNYFFCIAQSCKQVCACAIQKNHFTCVKWFLFVGMTGFEPATSSSRTKRATGLRYIPKSNANLQFF